MNVPNHAQSARITRDIRRMQQWQRDQSTPWSDVHTSWSGNSYSGYCLTETVEGANKAAITAVVYHLFHWSTEIATIEFREDEITRVSFLARYISTTTRGFQGRILQGLQQAGFDTNEIVHELALPTDQRGAVTYLTDRFGRSL